MLSMVSFFVGFLVGGSDDNVRSDRVIKSNLVRHFAINMES